MSRLLIRLLLPLLAALAGCDQIAVLDGSKAREADGVAVGSACRQAGRAIEDCFNMNPDAPKASVFAGWKEMNDYMVQNKLESVTPQVPRPDAKSEAKNKEEPKKEEAHAAAGEKPVAAAEAAATATVPGVPVVPATVNIPGLNTPIPAAPAAAPAVPATSAPATPAAPATGAAAPGGSSIALGGQNIPLSVPGSLPSIVPGAAPTPASAAPAHH